MEPLVLRNSRTRRRYGCARPLDLLVFASVGSVTLDSIVANCSRRGGPLSANRQNECRFTARNTLSFRLQIEAIAEDTIRVELDCSDVGVASDHT
jgi:hypothetical protein